MKKNNENIAKVNYKEPNISYFLVSHMGNY